MNNAPMKKDRMLAPAMKRERSVPPAPRRLGGVLVDVGRRTAREEMHSSALEFERLVSDLSSKVGRIQWDQIDDQIIRSMQALCTFAAADQCALVTIDRAKRTSFLSHQGTQDNSMSAVTVSPCAKSTPWLYDRLANRTETVSFSGLDYLPPEAAVDRLVLEQQGVRAALYIPYPLSEETVYVLALVYRNRECHALPRFTGRVGALGGVFVALLTRKSAARAEKEARDRLAATRRFSQSALDSLNKCIAVIDHAGTILEASKEWCTYRRGVFAEGVPVGGNYLQNLDACTGPERTRATKLASGLRNVLSGDLERFEMVWTCRPPDGGLVWIQMHVSRFNANDETFATISHEDISELRSKEQELQQLRAQHWHCERITRTGVLVSSLAHELSQPVSAILSNAQAAARFLAADAFDREENRQILVDIISDCKRAGGIIESLRLMLRRKKAEPRPVDVTEVVSNVIRLLHTELLSRQVDVQQACVPGCVVLGDRAQIQQVVLNIMMNGIEAMSATPSKDRKLRLEVRRADEGEIHLAVRDSGVGIRQAELDKVFSAFWTTKSSGTGMGLAICRSIVDSHRGRIWAEPNEGKGSTFHVALPALEAALEANFAKVREHPGGGS